MCRSVGLLLTRHRVPETEEKCQRRERCKGRSGTHVHTGTDGLSVTHEDPVDGTRLRVVRQEVRPFVVLSQDLSDFWIAITPEFQTNYYNI